MKINIRVLVANPSTIGRFYFDESHKAYINGNNIILNVGYAQYSNILSTLASGVSAGDISYSISDVSVVDFGAIGNAVFDNTTSFAAAKTFAEALSPIQEIYLPVGTFYTTTPFISTARIYGPGVVKDTGGGSTFTQHFDGWQLSSGTSNNDSSGSPGAATINASIGRSALAASATAVTITNSVVVAAQVVDVIPEDIDTTALRYKVVPAAGSFTVTWNAAATAALKFRWKVRS